MRISLCRCRAMWTFGKLLCISDNQGWITWRFPETGVPPVIIHFFMAFSFINHPFLGNPQAPGLWKLPHWIMVQLLQLLQPQWSQAADCCVARVLVQCQTPDAWLYPSRHAEVRHYTFSSHLFAPLRTSSHRRIQVVNTGGPFAGACQPSGCKYCNDDATLSGHWPQLFGFSPLAKQSVEHPSNIRRSSKWFFPKSTRI